MKIKIGDYTISKCCAMTECVANCSKNMAFIRKNNGEATSVNLDKWFDKIM